MAKGKGRTNHICKKCGKDFYPKGGHLKQPFCSKECAYEYRKGKTTKRKGKKYPHLQRARIGNCVLCGKEFRAVADFKTRKQKYCSKECWSHRNPPKTIFCPSCKSIFQSRGAKFCSLDCRNKAMIGVTFSKETKEKMSASKQGYMPVNIFKSGKDHPMWNPERTDQRERNTQKYKEWQLVVLRKDNFTCQICGVRGAKGIRPILQAHHIISWKESPDKRFDVSNGQTLCIACHKKTYSYQNRWQKAHKQEVSS